MGIGSRVVDVGAQDVHVEHGGELDELNAAIVARGGQPIVDASSLEAKEVFERARFEYWRCDVDQRPGTVYVDISTLVFPAEMRARFDYVGNVGTTEHLANPTAGFALIHFLCKAGGVMFHDVPLFGLGNHGLVNPTPKFWHQMIWMNDYDVLGFHVVPIERPRADDIAHSAWSYMKGIGDAPRSAMARVMLRKRGDLAFVPPLDVPLEAAGKDIRGLLMGSLQPFIAAGSYTVDDAEHAILGVLPRMSRLARLKRRITAAFR